MERERFQPVTRSALQVVAELEALCARFGSGVLAFDGDGTLWSGDVGEDVFHYSVQRGLLREEARDALVREANRFEIPAHGTTSEVAAQLFSAYLNGTYPERDVCAMMSWCYAGWTREELARVIHAAFEERALGARLTPELAPILAFARTAGLRVTVVSASPQPVVEYAAELWSIAAADVTAARPAIDSGIIAPRLASPLPYAETKVTALKALAGDRPVLASFGDNVFDIEMLHAARLAVAVRPKPALSSRLVELPNLVVLQSN